MKTMTAVVSEQVTEGQERTRRMPWIIQMN